ncbi:DUF11 domain-containing protein [Luteimonas mephitis]|uniref:DUF11 domain-containing protein n=1 Tax=Luteimonas mephitis TaxID=83615 RepID=UPI003A8CA726
MADFTPRRERGRYQQQHGASDAGDVITYTFSVSNTGTADLTNVVVSDAMLPGLVCTIASLPVGATNVACAKQQHVCHHRGRRDRGQGDNIVTATGTRRARSISQPRPARRWHAAHPPRWPTSASPRPRAWQTATATVLAMPAT